MRSGLGLEAPIFIAVCLGVRVGGKRMAWCACYSHAFGPGLPASSLCACRSWMKMHGTACALLINRAFRSELPSSSLCACQCWMEVHGTACALLINCVFRPGPLKLQPWQEEAFLAGCPVEKWAQRRREGKGWFHSPVGTLCPFSARDWFQESCHNRTWAAKLSQHSRRG